MLLSLLRLPFELLWIAYQALIGILDVARGRKRRRYEATVLIKAPRDLVWRFYTADRIVFDGPPALECIEEPVPGDESLRLTRVLVAGREVARVVARALRRDDAEGISLIEIVPHELSRPAAQGTDHYAGALIKDVPSGTLFTTHHEVTLGSFGQRIKLPLGVRSFAGRMKRQCEKAAGTQGRLAELANHWGVISLLALLSFWYLLGWQDALLITVVVVLHELGHAAAMRMAGIPVHGIYLIPFFGGVAVPKAAYRSQGQLGFIALMGAGFSLLPTLALAGYYYATTEPWALHAALIFALINGLNLLPIYPLDGGLVLNALLGSFNSRLARGVSWVGVTAGAAAGLYLEPLLLGLPFVVFALGLYLSSSWSGEIKRLSPLGGTALTLAFATTFAVYLVTFLFADNAKSVLAGREGIGPLQAWLPVPLRCELPSSSAGILDRYLGERGERDGLTLMRTLAWAARAGHRDIVQRRLDAPEGIRLPYYIDFATEARISRWLDLAKTGSLAAIDAEIASTRSHGSVLRHIFAMALVVHNRYREAVELLPPTEDTWRAFWLWSALADLVSAGAANEALTLLAHTRSDTLATGQSQHLVAVASLLHQLHIDSAKEALTDAIAQQLREVLKAHPLGPMPRACLQDLGRCSDPENKSLVRHLDVLRRRFDEVIALVSLGQTDFDLPGDAQVPPDWSPTLRSLHRLVTETAPAPMANRAGTPEAQPREDVENADPPADHDPFAFAIAKMRIDLSLRRGDTGKAEALAMATAGVEGMPVTVRTLLRDHYLRAGDWARADVWARRDALPGLGEEPPRELRHAIDLDFQLKLASAATLKGDAALADAALERARAASCERASLFVATRHEWSTFLRHAFLLKAFREGRVPAYAIQGRL
jgi:Zn-dependent protease